MINIIIVSVVFCAFMVLVVYLLSLLDKRLYKFLPTVIFLILSIILYIKSTYFFTSWQDNVYYFLYIIFFIASAITILSALIFKRKKK